jgi:hypothetical protein
LKTHKKVGLTVNLKNLVGINGNKNWLPHYREGAPEQGGDQFPSDRIVHRFERSLMEQFRRVFPRLGPLRRSLARPIKALGTAALGDSNVDTIRSGNWYGNDTTWRMVLDLSVVDGIVAGEGNGPLDPSPKDLGVVLAGANPVAVDLVAAKLMGFDAQRIPVLQRAFDSHPLPLTAFGPDEVFACPAHPDHGEGTDTECGPATSFVSHFGWRGHVDRDVASQLE